MNNQSPLLPEATFKPLGAARLEAMIDTALTHPQQQRSAQVIAFGPRLARTLGFSSGMAAMAASVMLAFMLTPQWNTGTFTTASLESASSASADIGDMLLLDSLGA